MNLKKKIEKTLSKFLKDGNFKISEKDSRVWGFIISSHFRGLNIAERQNFLYYILDRDLDKEEFYSILWLIPLTPEEEERYQ